MNGSFLQGSSALVLHTPENIAVNLPSMAVVKHRAEMPAQELPAKARDMAAERMTFCREVHNLIADRKTCAALAVAEAATRTELYPMLVNAGKNKSTALTLYNYRSWMRKIGTRRNEPDWNNLKALTDRYTLTVRGVHGDTAFWTVLWSFYLNENKLSVSEAYDTACRLYKKNNPAECATPEAIPTERQVRYWIETHGDRAAIMSARYGKTWAENNIMSYIPRDWKNVTPNEWWVGDHHIFDVPVRVWNKEKCRNEAVRPWLTAWLDSKSLYFVGIYISVDDPSSKSILTALQNGIRINGNTAPKMLYNDNGKDYLKRGFTEDFTPKGTDYRHSVTNELGIKCKTCLPYRARSKTIERMFGEVCSGFSKKWGAYLGNKPDARPEVASFYWDNADLLPSLQEFCEAFEKWLQEDFHARAQQGKILDGKAPAETWKPGTGGIKFNDNDLYYALLLPYTDNCPKVGRGGAVSIKNEEFRSDALLSMYGEKIVVKLDVVNGRAPHAYTLDGRHIATLEPVRSIPALATTEEDHKAIGEEMRRQRLELKRAFGVADEMSNGMRKVAPQELMSIEPGADVKFRRITSRRKSVKGANHQFTLLTAVPAAPGRELTRTEEKVLAIEQFDAMANQKKEEAEPEVSQEQLADFHKHMVNNERRRTHDRNEESWSRDG